MFFKDYLFLKNYTCNLVKDVAVNGKSNKYLNFSSKIEFVKHFR